MINFIIQCSLILIFLFFWSSLSVFLIENAEKEGKIQFSKINKLWSIKILPLFFDIFFNIRDENKIIKKKFFWIFAVNFLIFFILLKFIFLEITFSLFLNFFIISVLLLASIIDVKHRIVPNFIFYVFLLISIIFSINNSIFFVNFKESFVVLLFCLFVFYLGFLIFREDALGFGDIKLFFCVGLMFGLKGFFLIFCYSFFISAIFGLILKAVIFSQKFFKNNKEQNFFPKTYLPFVPFISVSLILKIYFEKYIVFF